jgi:hypothetical protein
VTDPNRKSTPAEPGDNEDIPPWPLVLARYLPFASDEEILETHREVTERVRMILRVQGRGTPESIPSTMAGGLPSAPAFLNASDEEIVHAYLEMSQTVRVKAELAEQIIVKEAIGSSLWRKEAEYIDRVLAASTVDGWAGARRARMLLLASIDDAVHYANRVADHAVHIETVRRLMADPDWRTWDVETRNAWKESAAVVALQTAFRAGEEFTAIAGHAPESDLTNFAAYLFRRRCAAFSRGLVTREALAALGVALVAWARGPGKRKKDDTAPPVWEACDALMKEAGLVGTTAESLKKDWESWRRRK